MRRNFIALALFVVVSLGLLAALALQLGVLGGRGAAYSVRLEDAGGLVVGNAVKIAGVPVGTITKIRLVDNKALLELKIDPEVPLYSGDCVQPWPKSLLGEKYLQLDQGRATSGPKVAPGAELSCARRPIDIGDVTNLARTVVESEESLYPLVVRMVKRLDAGTEFLDGELDLPGEEMRVIVSNIGRITAATAGLLEDNREAIGAAIQSSSALLNDPRIPRIIGNLDALAGKARADLPRLIDRADKALEELEKTSQRLSQTLDDRRVAEIGEILENTRAATADLKKFSANLEGVGKDLGPITGYTRDLLKRAAAFSVADFIRVFQVEGFKTHIGLFGARDAKKRLADAEAEETKTPEE
jgi:phospholipid/cholesterol/gamma-HCH transport system substrate-binding protein